MESAARQLARAASAGRFADAPAAVRAAYGRFLLDTVAVMAAGAAHPSVRAARAALLAGGGTGGATAIGMEGGTIAATAALLNGMGTTVLQLQDGHRRARGHPMSHVLPAALAVAEETGASAAAFLNAVMAGYEVSARIGAALGGMQPLLHDTGTFGTIGAAVAAAHLLSGGDAAVLEAAMENAAAVALFPFRDTCMEGAGVHHLFVGLGAQNGIHAARAALAGLAPAAATLERFFGPRAGEAFDPALLTSGLCDAGWERHEIEAAYLKWQPVCAHLGPMVDCIDILRDRLCGVDPAAIDHVRVEVYATALQYDCPDPATDLAARFSFRHTAALALCGPLRHDGFARAEDLPDQVRALAARVELTTDPALDRLYPASRPTRVTVRMAGRSETAEVTVPRGDGARALSDAEVREKATRLLSQVWDDAQAGDVTAAVAALAAGGGSPAALGLHLRRGFRA